MVRGLISQKQIFCGYSTKILLKEKKIYAQSKDLFISALNFFRKMLGGLDCHL